MAVQWSALVVFRGAPEEFGLVLFIWVGGGAGVDDLRGAFFGGADQVFIGATFRVLDIGVVVAVVGEDLRVDGGAFVAGSAESRFDPGGDRAVGGLGWGTMRSTMKLDPAATGW
jgi:hypothetical protein